MNKYLIAAILWAAIILVLTLTPGEHVPQVGVFSYDKLGHSIIFGIQSFLIPFGLASHPKVSLSMKSILIISLIFTIIYGAGLEIMQHFIPGRAMDYVDALANTLGAIVGIIAFYLLNKMKSKGVV